MKVDKRDEGNSTENSNSKLFSKGASTGPKTAAGKQRSSRNSIGHGIFAACVVIGSESLARYRALVRTLEMDLGIMGATEQLLVEKLAANLWRQARFYRAEGEIILRSAQISERFLKDFPDSWKSFCSKSSYNCEKDNLGIETPTTPSNEPIVVSGDQFANFMTIENHLGREFDRIFDQLELVRRFKKLVPTRSSPSKPSSIRK
jgi:hypothetical protein